MYELLAFCVAKGKNGNKGKRRNDFKAETIKRLSARLNVTVLAILEHREFKSFSCRPTMVVDNTLSANHEKICECSFFYRRTKTVLLVKFQ